MTTSRRLLPRTLALLLGALLCSGCSPASEGERSCPCAAGWTCCPDLNVCVADASRCEQLQPKPPDLTAPSAPRALAASREPGRVVLTWFEPEDDGGSPLTGYGVEVDPREDGQQVRVEGDSASVTGLRAGGVYRFTVAARNAVGAGSTAVVESVKLPDVPGAPRVLAIRQGDRQVGVEWEAPASDGGHSILHYVVTAWPTGRSVMANSAERTAVLGGLTNGASTTFTVRAVNAVGEGPDSAHSHSVVPAAWPGLPVAVSATPSVRGASVTWSRPEDTGGLPVDAYVVMAAPGGATLEVDGAETSVTFTRLLDDTTYTFTVAARNAVGQGPDAASATARTPARPGAPSVVHVEPGVRSLFVSWGPPVSDGRSALIGFTVLAEPSGVRVEVGASAREAVLESVPSTRAQVITVTAHNAVGSGDAAMAPALVRTHPAPAEVYGLEAPADETGCRYIEYSLRQVDGERADVLVEVDSTGDGVFRRATQASDSRYLWPGFPPTSGLEALATSSVGMPHIFRWNRSRDVPGAAAAARMRITATVPGARPFASTLPVPLDPIGRRCEVELGASPVLELASDTGNFNAPLTSGDFDRDGRPDLVVGTDYPSGFSYLWGRGNGSFDLFAEFDTPATKNHLVAVDMDGDGVLDLVAVNPSFFFGESVHVFLGRGNGDFHDAVTSRVLAPDDAPYPTAPVAADLDGDGRPELVVSQRNSLVILRHTGGGEMAVAFEDFVTPRGAVVSGDFDEDGLADVMVVGSTLHAFIGRGRLDFTKEHLGSLEGRISVAEAADFDGDGHLDIAALAIGNDEASILLLRGDGRGRFGAPTVLHHHTWRPYWGPMSDLVARDLDGDGAVDLAYVRIDKSVVTLLQGLGDGSFTLREIPTTEHPTRLAVADFDGSGRLDIAVLSQMHRNVRVIRDLEAPQPPPIGHRFATADFDGDGWKDVASLMDGDLQVHLTRAEGGLVPRGPSTAPPGAEELLPGRFDAGPTTDLLVRSLTGPPAVRDLSLVRGRGDGTFTEPEPLLLGDVSEGAIGDLFAAGDVDGDGDLDVVFNTHLNFSGYQTNNVYLLRNRGDGTFEDGGKLAAYSSLRQLALTDLNRDGRADLLVLRPVAPAFEIIMFEARADGRLLKVREYTPGVSCSASKLVVEDLNLDGRVDMTVSCGRVGVLPIMAWGDFIFFPKELQPVGSTASGLAIEDLNGDRVPELLVSDVRNQAICVVPSRGIEDWLPGRCFGTLGILPTELALLDVDHDGVLEVLVGSIFGETITTLLHMK
ncbi:FG-GAP-like repeat-containing protein [Myxococcus sp. CA040A]|uniref:FG-GAP-like repeat-containing protein n=1 Tax=Myxococcus sp. CA040A TaxID=2741738 RepID=UPI00157B27A4|nr:FG-GAP-like repeat-containing protein [Myxococcus sp. CA040A]NTX07269.1 VCBS repeat-containing protein [Myxococcus sp. CA040A]